MIVIRITIINGVHDFFEAARGKVGIVYHTLFKDTFWHPKGAWAYDTSTKNCLHDFQPLRHRYIRIQIGSSAVNDRRGWLLIGFCMIYFRLPSLVLLHECLAPLRCLVDIIYFVSRFLQHCYACSSIWSSSFCSRERKNTTAIIVICALQERLPCLQS